MNNYIILSISECSFLFQKDELQGHLDTLELRENEISNLLQAKGFFTLKLRLVSFRNKIWEVTDLVNEVGKTIFGAEGYSLYYAKLTGMAAKSSGIKESHRGLRFGIRKGSFARAEQVKAIFDASYPWIHGSGELIVHKAK